MFSRFLRFVTAIQAHSLSLFSAAICIINGSSFVTRGAEGSRSYAYILWSGLPVCLIDGPHRNPNNGSEKSGVFLENIPLSHFHILMGIRSRVRAQGTNHM